MLVAGQTHDDDSSPGFQFVKCFGKCTEDEDCYHFCPKSGSKNTGECIDRPGEPSICCCVNEWVVLFSLLLDDK